LFATPPAGGRAATFEAFAEGGSAFPSTGLLILAAIAVRYGHETVFKDFLNAGSGVEEAVKKISDIKPDWICISSNTDMIL